MKNPLVKNILIVKLDHAGDVLWATPVLSALRKNNTNTHISFLCTPYTAPVLENHPAVDAIVPYNQIDFSSDREKKAFLNHAIPKPDLTLCLDTRNEALRMTQLSGAPHRAGYYYFPRGLSTFLPFLRLTMPVLHPATRGDYCHEVTANLRLLQKVGLATQLEETTEICLTDLERQKASTLLQTKGIAVERLIAVHLPLKWLDGHWPEDILPEMARRLLHMHSGIRILLTCGPNEESLLQRVLPLFPDSTIALTGLDFRIWAAVFAQCSLVISRDCGPVHVAAALGVPVISVFEESKRREHTRWEPWMVPHANIFRPDRFQADAVESFFDDILHASQALLLTKR